MKNIKKHYANRWIILLFLAISLLLYSSYYYFISGDFAYIFDNFILKLAFLPIYVLFTTLLLDGLLTLRESKINNRKKNMIIGVFFTEVGKRLLVLLSVYCNNIPELNKQLIVTDKWTSQDYQEAKELIKNTDFKIGIHCSIDEVHEFLLAKREFMIQLLQNPNILEDESFTNLLLASFHLSEELVHRTAQGELRETDIHHLAIDVKRIYGQLIYEWLNYLEHLSKNYPFLFSIEARINPLRGLSGTD